MAKFGVFIIEFLRGEDVWEGEALETILQACRIPVKYEQADAVEDLERLLEEFKKSGLRYLHLSCHGDSRSIEINGEEVTNAKLEQMLSGKLNKRRIFMASCKGANRDLASRVIRNCGAYSLVGTPVDLAFKKSAVFWPAFYHLMKELDKKKMNRRNLQTVLQKCVDLFTVPVNFYSRIEGSHTEMYRLKVRQARPAESGRLDFTQASLR